MWSSPKPAMNSSQQDIHHQHFRYWIPKKCPKISQSLRKKDWWIEILTLKLKKSPFTIWTLKVSTLLKMIWIHGLSPWSTRDSRRTSTPTSALFNFRPVDQKHQRGHQILSHLIWFEIMSITNIRIWKLESVFILYFSYEKLNKNTHNQASNYQQHVGNWSAKNTTNHHNTSWVLSCAKSNARPP